MSEMSLGLMRTRSTKITSPAMRMKIILIILSLLVCYNAANDADKYCRYHGCCEEDCCGPGTSWQGELCVQDFGSQGFDGTYSPDYKSGCVRNRKCCEHDCCDEGTFYDGDIQCCMSFLSGAPMTPTPSSITPTPSIAPSPAPTKCDCPDTSEKAVWDTVREKNNCYSYAANDNDEFRAQPGWQAGIEVKPKDTTCAKIEQATMADATSQGKEVTKVLVADHNKPDDEKCPEGKCLVALYVEKNGQHPLNGEVFNDYHWFRYNDNTGGGPSWSHKQGSGVVQEVAAPPMPVHNTFYWGKNHAYHFCSFLCFPWQFDVTGSTLDLFFGKSIRLIQQLLGFIENYIELTVARVDFILSIMLGTLERRRILLALESIVLPTAPDPEWGENPEGGFEIVNAGEYLEFPDRLRVWNGTIEVTISASVSYYEDVDSVLWDYLVDEFLQIGPVYDGTLSGGES